MDVKLLLNLVCLSCKSCNLLTPWYWIFLEIYKVSRLNSVVISNTAVSSKFFYHPVHQSYISTVSSTDTFSIITWVNPSHTHVFLSLLEIYIYNNEYPYESLGVTMFYPNDYAKHALYYTGYPETANATDNKHIWNQQARKGWKYLSWDNFLWFKLIHGKLFPDGYLLPIDFSIVRNHTRESVNLYTDCVL